jgi:uncharacterized protein (TIGR04255 family)
MSTLIKYLKPYNSNHSIRECGITLFLFQPIVKFEPFKESSRLKDNFQRIQDLKAFKIELKHNFENITSHTSDEDSTIGVEFTSFLNGKEKFVLQIKNQRDKQDSNTISFHALQYDRWQPFRKEFYEIIDDILSLYPNIYIKAVGIHYIDDFFWIGNDEIPVRQIFNNTPNILPNNFFESTDSAFTLVTQPKTDTYSYYDRLEVRVNPKTIEPEPSIRVFHNIIQPLSNVIDLNNFANTFKNNLDEVHNRNKATLRQLLCLEVQKIINLN